MTVVMVLHGRLGNKAHFVVLRVVGVGRQAPLFGGATHRQFSDDILPPCSPLYIIASSHHESSSRTRRSLLVVIGSN